MLISITTYKGNMGIEKKDKNSLTQVTKKVGQALKLTLQSTHGSCGTGWIYEINKTKDKRITTTLHLDKSEC